jgi:hypothetical protein
MRHHKKKTMRKRGGAWLDPSSWEIFQKKPEQVVQDAPKVTEDVIGDVVEPVGGTPEPTNTPGGMSPEAPAALLGGRRRRRKTKRSRKSRR